MMIMINIIIIIIIMIFIIMINIASALHVKKIDNEMVTIQDDDHG